MNSIRAAATIDINSVNLNINELYKQYTTTKKGGSNTGNHASLVNQSLIVGNNPSTNFNNTALV